MNFAESSQIKRYPDKDTGQHQKGVLFRNPKGDGEEVGPDTSKAELGTSG